MDRPGVWAGGFRAWADSAGYLATGRAAGAGRMLRVPAASLGELVRTWFPFGIHMIEGFFQTVRNMEAMSRQREALVALGGLAAGLAHELNNPAAAAVRAVDAVEATCNGLLASLVLLAERSLSAEQFIAIESMRSEIDPPTGPVDPIAVADREDALLVWLDAHGLDDGWRIAPDLAAAGVEVAWCQRVDELLDGQHLGPALEWTAGTLSLAALLQEVKESTGARVGARRRGEVVLPARPGVGAAHRHHRGHREHAGDARSQAQDRGDRGP